MISIMKKLENQIAEITMILMWGSALVGSHIIRPGPSIAEILVLGIFILIISFWFASAIVKRLKKHIQD